MEVVGRRSGMWLWVREKQEGERIFFIKLWLVPIC